MGLSSSTAKTTSSQNTTQTGTTTPVAPDWLTGGLKDYIGSIGSFADADPNSFVAGASPLQQQAWNNTDRLGLWTGNSNAASNIAMNAANAPAAQLPGAAGYTAARGGVSTYSPATLANPREATATGYNAAQGQGAGYNAATLGSASQATGSGYNAAHTGPVSVAPVTNASATDANPSMVSQFMGGYKNPYESDVVNTTLAGFDQNAARQRAQMEAQGAKAGAFGGSRFGLAEGQFAADNALNRTSTEAQLRSAGFDKAAALGSTDAGAANQASLFNAQNRTGVSLANAGAANQHALSQAGIDAQLGLSNTDAANQASLFGATAGNTASLANQGANNSFALAQAGMQNDAARYGADTSNNFALANMGAQNQAAAFGATAQNNAGMANQNASNTFALSQAGAQNDAARYGADANNASMASYLGRADQAASQGAASQNQASLFNAQAQETGLSRQLQAAGLLNGFGNDYGANTRADLGAMASLGQDQRSIEQGYSLAPLAQLQAVGSLFGATPYQALVGQNVSSTGTANGTGTQSQSPSLFNQLLAAGSLASNFF